MTEYKTASIEKEMLENFQEHVRDNTDFRNVKEWLIYLGRREIEEDRLRQIVKEELDN